MDAPDTSRGAQAGANSPWFARAAAGLLTSGDLNGALMVCLAGTRMFPRYATGRLMLGRCYDALGRHIEAMLEYRRVIDVFPDNPVVGELLRNAMAKEQKGYSNFAGERLERLKVRKNRISFDDYMGKSDTSGETSVERIIKQLEEAPRRIQSPPDEPPPPPSNVEINEPSGRFVTATLAEIYASQGEYDEAIEAYRKLAEQRPGSAERYQKRLIELEELKRAHNDGENV